MQTRGPVPLSNTEKLRSYELIAKTADHLSWDGHPGQKTGISSSHRYIASSMGCLDT